jgi:hypothetical protein
MRILSAVTLSLALALTGCGLFATPSSGPLVVDSRSPITDVPVPAGFTLADDSRSNVINGQRLVDHRYKGTDQLLPVTSFYRDEMPKRGWKSTGTELVSGKESILRFSKENTSKPETCTITVTARDLTFDTTIKIKIEPK